jgi:hypothetical protein
VLVHPYLRMLVEVATHADEHLGERLLLAGDVRD